MKKKKENEVEVTVARKESIYYDSIIMIFIIGLFSIDFFPNFGALEIIEPQFLYIAILNLGIMLFVYYNPTIIAIDLISIFKRSAIVQLYLAFILLCCFSIITSHNVSLSIISGSRLLLLFSLFINLSILLRNRLYLINNIVFVLIITTFLQSLLELFEFIKESKLSSITLGLSNLKGNTGNINIFAASLCVKIPFILFGIISTSTWKKWFYFGALFLSTTCIFLTTSRATFVGLTLEIVLFSLGFFYLLKRKDVKLLYTLYLVLLISFGISNIIISKNDDVSRNESAIGRLANIQEDASANARLTLWNNAFKISQDYPLTGIGLGNWKVELLKYEKYLFTSTTISTHAHNDFLEIIAETGYLNGVVFITLFILIIVVNLKRIRDENDLQTKKITGLVLLVFISYSVDAFFNFPLYRPTMQLLLCLCIVLTIVNTNGLIKNYENKIKLIFKIGFLLWIMLGLCCVYFNFLSFKASQLEQKIVSDQTLQANDILPQLPVYPNLGIHGFPFIEYVGIKYYVDKDYKKAFKYFKLAEKLNPYSDSDYYQAAIFKETGKIDSAYYYIKKSFSNRPRYEEYFKSIVEVATLKKDTVGILKIHNEYNTHTHSPNNWIVTSRALFDAKYSLPKIIDFLNAGLKEYPNDDSISQQKLVFQAQVYSEKRKFDLAINVYKEILKRDPTNMLSVQNIGICYFNLGKYKESLGFLSKTLKTPELASKSEELVKMIRSKMNVKN